MACHLAHDMEPISKPGELAASRDRKNRDLAILALIPVLRYGLAIAIESETSVSVVCTVVFIMLSAPEN
jgi:hypothetical protein